MTGVVGRWSLVRKILFYGGFVGCGVDFILSLGLIAYYSANRPHLPEPTRGWIVRLKWSLSPPSFGTVDDNALLLALFHWFFAFFMLIALAEVIRIYKLGRRG